MFRYALTFIALFASAYAADGPAPKTIETIEFTGLGKTRTYVAEREILFRPGERYDEAAFQESKQRLRNLRIFSSVEGDITDTSEGKVKVRFEVREKWTTMPILQFGTAGGAAFLILGVYDVNLLGNFREIGGQYEYLSGAHSALFWFRNPRVFDRRILFGTDIGVVTRNRILYGENGNPEGGFTLARKRLNLFSDYEFSPIVTAGAGVIVDFDEVSDAKLSDAIRALNAANGIALGTRQHNLEPFLHLALGRIDYDDYLAEGYLADFTLLDSPGYLGSWGSETTFYRLTTDHRLFLRTPFHGNLGLRLVGSATNSRDLHQLSYVGALESVRGFYDGQFRSRRTGVVNLEYRIPSLRNYWLVLQHAVFLDNAIYARELPDAPATTQWASAIGTGVRLIVPAIYRLNLRFDFAWGLRGPSQSVFSLGHSQFF